jgi:two-component system cell cycle sensor histidine kinase/response regulator CckA
VEQAVVNLVVNASDAMPQGGELTLRTGQEDAGRVWVSVSDTGPGIPEEIRERVFEPFFTTREADGGSGLGLAVVHGIVTQHGGSIELETRSGAGTTFRVLFPQAEAAQAPPAQAVLGTPESERAGEGSRVLLVEDAAGVREWLEEALKMLGYEVVTAATAREALELPDHPAINLLLSDVLLPDTAGPELADRLTSRWGNLAVVFMSGYAKDHLLTRHSFNERVRFLQKPFTLDSLARELQGALQGVPQG